MRKILSKAIPNKKQKSKNNLPLHEQMSRVKSDFRREDYRQQQRQTLQLLEHCQQQQSSMQNIFIPNNVNGIPYSSNKHNANHKRNHNRNNNNSSHKNGPSIRNSSHQKSDINLLTRGTCAIKLCKDCTSGSSSISTNTHSNNENLVNGRYEIKSKLGQGSFGEVRLAFDVKTGNQYAIKFEHKSDEKKHLTTEYYVYNAVRATGFPKIYWFGPYLDYTALVMEKLGVSLKVLYSRCNRIFPVPTVALIAIQILERVETLHDQGWLHQDVKPENMTVGVGDKSHTLYLIDYGTSIQFIDEKTKKHRIRAQSTKIVGTARYSSLTNHFGFKQSRRDDLESLGYTLIYWLLGRLPWQGIDERDYRVKWKKVRKCKRAISPDELCRGLPVQFRVYMKYIFKLSYAQRPNYGYLRGLFRQLLPTLGVVDELQFAWERFGIRTE